MTFISKTAGCLSLVSCVHDIHKSALIYSKNKYVKASANATIENSLNMQKANHLSYKDTRRKNWLNQSNFFAPIRELFAKVSGYVEGALKTSVRYIPNFVLASVALFAKNNKKLANIAALGLGAVEGVDFAVNSLGVGQKNDYLKL